MLWWNFSILILILFVQLIAGSKCPENGWIDCGNGKCVAQIWRCDGDNDCGNLKDEENCQRDIKPKPCPGFQCVEDGHCIPETWHCDGEQDCGDNSDELGCDGETLDYPCIGFRCKDRHCIPETWRCDGRMDCPDESDEEGCPIGFQAISLKTNKYEGFLESLGQKTNALPTELLQLFCVFNLNIIGYIVRICRGDTLPFSYAPGSWYIP
ncbi:hypothetical protein JTE90_021969 [Oedothorax gibbosus]|uniref:Uncharacterized protein n=1 Tax=Oedothorax gibbosus TaxID=931172 RepID=A0AAV6TTJ2_9ARAC|nr:hypothetical protein JTE90_021969 [Oedothorax gibbosus]